MITLRNQNLEVQIDAPGEVYSASRFDWTGQVNQVILNGKHSFLTTETTDDSLRTLKGIGLCSEFGINSPVGYADCPPGGYYPKIGVGLLLKENENPYDFFYTYQKIKATFKLIPEGTDRLRIVSFVAPCREYAYYYEKIYSLEGNTLTISYLLKNSGTKPIVTEEYCHNFVCLNNLPVDSNYKLYFDIPLEKKLFTAYVNPDGCSIVEPDGISWQTVPASDFFFANLGPVSSWTIENSKSGTSVTEEVNFNTLSCNLWGKGHVISPEIFIDINIKPGQTMEWERKYTFKQL